MTEKIARVKLTDLLPNDFPYRNSWLRVNANFPVAVPTLLDLDSIMNHEGRPGVVVTAGMKYGYAVRDGNHTVAKILQLFGPEAEVSFTPNVELRDWHAPGEFQEDVDWRVELVAKWGVTNFVEFLACCVEGRFYIAG